MAADDTVATSSSDRADTAASAPRQRWWRRPAVALVIALAIGAAFAPSSVVAAAANGGTAPATATGGPSASTGDALVITNATVEPGGTAVHRIVLTDAPDGLAGFELTLELSGDAAAVENAGYPDDYRMTTDPVVSDDGESVTVEAVDLDDAVTPGASDVTLATVTVNGTEPGAAALEVTDARLDADGGSRIDPTREPGTLTVQTDATAAESTGTPDDGSDAGDGAASNKEPAGGTDGSDDDSASNSEAVPGFAGGTALLALAVLAGGLLARRQDRSR
ncbi:hypothetical protein NP511_06415 [Natrinema thermotolerans]|uniref:PGF-CTERM protein n=1 Tax=Natrinema thermotolerans TaxID=121872 RepID=A0AAF0PDP6_9EURY|nr:hypothetical protein [Natrinema thermotolerans]QCC58157.1 hypothetical protein DVR14_05700 [Natrinema thermotolerans]WMT09265.1 hypothetical protein NP511_06415 [Natrinema thermotolerans]